MAHVSWCGECFPMASGLDEASLERVLAAMVRHCSPAQTMILLFKTVYSKRQILEYHN